MSISASSQLPYLRRNLSSLTRESVPLWHPLGFVSSIIREEPGNCIVRVHYWPEGERRTKSPDWPIHTHAYDLSSLVLTGRVRDIRYTDKSGSEYAVYSVTYSGGDSSISWTGRETSVESVVDRYHEAGEEYSVPVGSFHQTHVVEEETALTLVALSNFQRANPLVLGSAAGNEHYPYNRTPFDRACFWQAVERAINDLSGKI